MIAVYVVGFLIFGCLNTLTTKILFTSHPQGANGEPGTFQKPWFAVWAMFVGMAVNLLFHLIYTAGSKDPTALVDSDKQQLTPVKKFLWVGVPAMFDLTTTFLSSVGLLYISASIWQMLRGANIIFSALFSVAFLGRKMRAYNWLGVAVVITGVSMVGLSNALMSSEKSESSVNLDSGSQLFGMGMVILAQLFSGGQVVTEEKLLKNLNVPKLQLVGYEGVWGSLVMIPIFAIMYNIPGNDDGSYENSFDTYTKLTNGGELMGVVALYTFCCMSYNLCAVCVTGALSAVHRTMFMALRTLIVWVVDLSVHYLVNQKSSMGEVWSSWSYLELAGFIVLVTGQVIYAGLVQVPGMNYAASPACSPQNFQSPSAMKMESPGLPPASDFDVKDGVYIKLTEES